MGYERTWLKDLEGFENKSIELEFIIDKKICKQWGYDEPVFCISNTEGSTIIAFSKMNSYRLTIEMIRLLKLELKPTAIFRKLIMELMNEKSNKAKYSKANCFVCEFGETCKRNTYDTYGICFEFRFHPELKDVI